LLSLDYQHLLNALSFGKRDITLFEELIRTKLSDLERVLMFEQRLR
jgi:hypothetical protein